MGDASTLLRQSYQLIQQATQNDRIGNYQEALRLYLTGLEGFVSALRIEKNEKVRVPLKQKMAEYMDRAEQLKQIIQKKSSSPHHDGEICTLPHSPVHQPIGGNGLVLPSVPTSSPLDSLDLPSVPSSLPGKPSAPFIETPYFPVAPQSSPSQQTQQYKPSPSTSSSTPISPNGKTHQKIRIEFGHTGFSYDSLFGKYLSGATKIIVEDPYIRSRHQIENFVRFCELVVKRANNNGKPLSIKLITSSDSPSQEEEIKLNLKMLKESLIDMNVILEFTFSQTLHDRSIEINNGTSIKLGRGLDIYQKPQSKFCIGYHDLDYRPCLETTIDIYKV